MTEPRVIIVTGLSGAGRSQAANALEDMGYFVVDNLPPSLIVDVVDRIGTADGARSRVATVVDTRGGVTADQLEEALAGLSDRSVLATILYLDADDAALSRRFEETRRTHPVTEGTLAEKIAIERAAFEDIRGMADVIIDTSDLTVHDLRRRVEAAFGDEADAQRMRINVVSFGFKRGVPRVVDVMFDVRFLPNPHWDPKLRPQTGLDDPVRTYVLDDADTQAFLAQLEGMLEFLVPRYRSEGKSYLTIGIGCTGGRHRSVAIAEELGRRLSPGSEVDVTVAHRDLPDRPVS
ncbi:MAG: RNase adapter RapZ [Acidimicrobiia bacterium]|nr:RNase adapter RapZ [Acidimicrobiia bacterium]